MKLEAPRRHVCLFQEMTELCEEAACEVEMRPIMGRRVVATPALTEAEQFEMNFQLLRGKMSVMSKEAPYELQKLRSRERKRISRQKQREEKKKQHMYLENVEEARRTLRKSRNTVGPRVRTTKSANVKTRIKIETA